MPANAQRLTVRVYYEDTDFSGRVYHASYLRFFERGRTEWLRAIGFSHSVLAQSSETAFAVTRLQIDFLAPAFIDDQLEVVTQLQGARGPILVFQQRILREGAPLTKGVVEVVTIRKNRPIRPPRDLLAALTDTGEEDPLRGGDEAPSSDSILPHSTPPTP